MTNITRRGFLKAAGIAGAGLALSRLPIPEYIPDHVTNRMYAKSIHVKFDSDETVYRLVYSFDPGDGQPVQHHDLANGTGSPFVKLAERT